MMTGLIETHMRDLSREGIIMSKGSKNASKGSKGTTGTTSPAKGRKGRKGDVSSPVVVVPANNVRPNGKIVDVVPPDQLKRECDALLIDLHREGISRNAKKGIRRKLRVRGYYISQKGGGLSTRVPVTTGEGDDE